MWHQTQYFGDFDEVAGAHGKTLFLNFHFSMRAVLGEILAGVRSTLSSLCESQFALVVARCEF